MDKKVETHTFADEKTGNKYESMEVWKCCANKLANYYFHTCILPYFLTKVF